MAHFAQLNEENIVTQVIVVANQDTADQDGVENEAIGIAFCTNLLGGNWKQTSYNGNIRKNYAGIGYKYDADLDAFVPPQPFASWTLNTELYNTVSIKFTNKDANDTIVDQTGKIVKDKFLEIVKFSVNDVDLIGDIEFYQQQCEYIENDQKVMPRFGFWFNNSTLSLSFEKNFDSWYHIHSKKNTEFNANIITTTSMKSTVGDNSHRQQLIDFLDKLDY